MYKGLLTLRPGRGIYVCVQKVEVATKLIAVVFVTFFFLVWGTHWANENLYELYRGLTPYSFWLVLSLSFVSAITVVRVLSKLPIRKKNKPTLVLGTEASSDPPLPRLLGNSTTPNIKKRESRALRKLNSILLLVGSLFLLWTDYVFVQGTPVYPLATSGAIGIILLVVVPLCGICLIAASLYSFRKLSKQPKENIA